MLIKGWACRIGLEWVPTYQYVATVNLDGTVMGTERPKMEVDIHRLVYKVRDDVGAVIHAHPSYLTAFMMVRHKLNKSQESFLKNYTGGINEVLTEAPAAADAVHGSIELAENVAEAFKGNKKKLVFMENQGKTVAGGDLYDAFFTLDNMENVAKVFFLVHMKLE
jgi:L-fuculose-phosphate aldolase